MFGLLKSWSLSHPQEIGKEGGVYVTWRLGCLLCLTKCCFIFEQIKIPFLHHSVESDQYCPIWQLLLFENHTCFKKDQRVQLGERSSECDFFSVSLASGHQIRGISLLSRCLRPCTFHSAAVGVLAVLFFLIAITYNFTEDLEGGILISRHLSHFNCTSFVVCVRFTFCGFHPFTQVLSSHLESWRKQSFDICLFSPVGFKALTQCITFLDHAFIDMVSIQYICRLLHYLWF